MVGFRLSWIAVAKTGGGLENERAANDDDDLSRTIVKLLSSPTQASNGTTSALVPDGGSRLKVTPHGPPRFREYKLTTSVTQFSSAHGFISETCESLSARSTLINRYLLAPLIGPIINLFLKYTRKVSANETLDYERSSIVDEFLTDTFNATRGD